ncbi:MAG: rhomboid family intramembrane serine protease [Bacteroidia bacterium]|nr:rhomboid family intramembrane serine protease [Bacteroidia bacterium]
MLDRLTPITKHLILINVVVFVALLIIPNAQSVDETYFVLNKSNALGFRGIGIYQGEEYLTMNVKGQDLAVTPADAFNPVQIVTSFFNHSKRGYGGRIEIFHILFNMLVLGMFGPVCESVLGSKRFLNFYLFCGVVASLLLTFLDPSPIPVLGASTAVSGVLVAFAMTFPNQKMGIMFLPIYFKSRDFVLGLAAISALLVILQVFGINIGGGISHFGHLAGMVAGYLFFKIEKYLPLPK